MTQTKQTMYALRDTTTGKLLYLEKEENVNRYCCGEYTYRIVSYETNEGFFQVDSKVKMWYALYNPECWYNSDAERPTHSLDVNQIEIVERVITIEENEIYPEPNAYYDLVERFYRDHYTDERAQYVDKWIEEIREYDGTLSLSQWQDFIEWMKKNNLTLPQTCWGEEV